MTPHQIIAVAVRLFAIWLAIFTARMAPAFYRENGGADGGTAGFAVVAACVVVALFILFLWLFPLTVARALLDSNKVVAAAPISADTWFAVGCALLGLWLLVPALAALIYNLSVLYLAQRDASVDTSGLRPALIYYLIEIGFGVWLLLGARGARRLFWAVRNER